VGHDRSTTTRRSYPLAGLLTVTAGCVPLAAGCQQWVVRYPIVKHGFWILGRETLNSPMSVTDEIRDLDLISGCLRRRNSVTA
jgi:hypothetical protein